MMKDTKRPLPQHLLKLIKKIKEQDYTVETITSDEIFNLKGGEKHDNQN